MHEEFLSDYYKGDWENAKKHCKTLITEDSELWQCAQKDVALVSRSFLACIYLLVLSKLVTHL
jgi:hypothetical protein